MLIFTLCNALMLFGLLEIALLFITSDCRKCAQLTPPKQRLTLLENAEVSCITLSEPGITKRSRCQAVCTTPNRLFPKAGNELLPRFWLNTHLQAWLYRDVAEGNAGSSQIRGSRQHSD